MRYSRIRAFHHVATHGGFSRAAAALNQTQPALSEQVRRLEEAHDALLFHRDGRQVRLTEAGEGLFRLTRRYFEVEGEIEAHLDRSRSAVAGRLRIVADAAHHITGALQRFRAAHPTVFVAIRTGNTEEVLRALRNYEAEIGVLGGDTVARDLAAQEIGRSPIVAMAVRGVLPPGRLKFRALAHLPLVFREDGSRTRAILERAAAEQGLTLTPAIEVEGREAMREVVAAGAGVGFVSEAEFGSDHRLALTRLSGVDLTMVETLVHLKQRRDAPAIRAFAAVAARAE